MPTTPWIVQLALPGAKIPVVNLDDVEAIIEIILRHACAC
jgi:hypothetical protein